MREITKRILAVSSDLTVRKMPVDDLAYLVSNEEWDEILDDIQGVEMFLSDRNNVGRLHSVKVGNLEVKRRYAP